MFARNSLFALKLLVKAQANTAKASMCTSRTPEKTVITNLKNEKNIFTYSD